MINVLKEPIPDWSTPVFIVDQDAKGMLGRMVCAYGPVNKQLEINTFQLRLLSLQHLRIITL